MLQKKLSLDDIPAYRVEFEIVNDPVMNLEGTKVDPLPGMNGTGGGTEFKTMEPVKVKIINYTPLK